MTVLRFATGSNQNINPVVSNERLYNMYAEVDRKIRQAILHRTPGTIRLPGTPLSNGPCRGAFEWQDVGFMVIGNQLYQFTPSGSGFDIQARGTLASSSGRVTITADLDEVVIVDGTTAGYVYNTDTGVFSTINDPDFRGGTHVAHLNGFIISNQPTSNVWQISRPQTALDYDALDIAVGESDGDNIQAVMVHEERVWLLGSKTYEVWGPSASDFPFDRQAVLQVGCGAPYSACHLDNSLVWLDWQGMVRITSGYRTQVISNQAFADAVAKMPAFSDAFAYSYTERQHFFYVLTFPTANQTWVYDLQSNEWHERGYRNPLTQLDERHLSNCHMYVGGKHLVGDYRDGRVYDMTENVRTDDETLQRWEVITPTVFDPNDPSNPLRFYELSLIARTGVGNQQTMTPSVRMSYSDDGGESFSDETRRAANLGQGLRAAAQSIKWRRLGRSKFKGRQFRFRGDDDVTTSLIALSAKMTA